jgi:hypothetical protein
MTILVERWRTRPPALSVLEAPGGLGHLAAAVRPPPRPRPEVQAHALSALLTRRRQVGPRLTAERRRLQRAPQRLRADIQAPSPWLERRVAPFNGDRGRLRGQRVVWGGRALFSRLFA